MAILRVRRSAEKRQRQRHQQSRQRARPIKLLRFEVPQLRLGYLGLQPVTRHRSAVMFLALHDVLYRSALTPCRDSEIQIRGQMVRFSNGGGKFVTYSKAPACVHLERWCHIPRWKKSKLILVACAQFWIVFDQRHLGPLKYGFHIETATTLNLGPWTAISPFQMLKLIGFGHKQWIYNHWWKPSICELSPLLQCVLFDYRDDPQACPLALCDSCVCCSNSRRISSRP